MQPFAAEAPALAATSGIAAIDALLPYVGADTPREIITARWRFLGRLWDAMHEPAGTGGRGRKDKAKATAQHLRDAAAGFQELGSDGLAKALVQLAALTEARARVSMIDVAQLSSREIVPGTRLLATHRPKQLSAYYTNKRGAASHRAELIRFVCHALQATTPPALVASLMRDVLGINCASADVHQALAQQGKSAQVPSDADAALRAWN
ncbi:MAG: hypothetical protein M0P72_01965 [Metallibacterium scheffleri]|uniref:hypothetical protein n=1 Tax=Metallibacterium scheffleri TaxID=993689 RepID=UPI0026EBAC9D|nr:hypothetical protein [Metallibacterium scheffleri]MCK9365901.1 hypothetical protein [Metallibacterium scheffleri]